MTNKHTSEKKARSTTGGNLQLENFADYIPVSSHTEDDGIAFDFLGELTAPSPRNAKLSSHLEPWDLFCELESAELFKESNPNVSSSRRNSLSFTFMGSPRHSHMSEKAGTFDPATFTVEVNPVRLTNVKLDALISKKVTKKRKKTSSIPSQISPPASKSRARKQKKRVRKKKQTHFPSPDMCSDKSSSDSDCDAGSDLNKRSIVALKRKRTKGRFIESECDVRLRELR